VALAKAVLEVSSAEVLAQALTVVPTAEHLAVLTEEPELADPDLWVVVPTLE
jgi:hypothetical protein